MTVAQKLHHSLRLADGDSSGFRRQAPTLVRTTSEICRRTAGVDDALRFPDGIAISAARPSTTEGTDLVCHGTVTVVNRD
jgi:hypothetical protein